MGGGGVNGEVKYRACGKGAEIRFDGHRFEYSVNSIPKCQRMSCVSHLPSQSISLVLLKNKNARSRIIKLSTDATSVCRERIKPL